MQRTTPAPHSVMPVAVPFRSLVEGTSFSVIMVVAGTRCNRHAFAPAPVLPLISSVRRLLAMSQKTVSELLFEQLCRNCGIEYEEVPTEATPTNDYDIFPQNEKIVCEVKQIDPDEDERAWLAGDRTRWNPWPGNRLRKPIKDGSTQLKSKAKGKFPTVLIIYNNVPVRGHHDAWNVLTAMYGQETVRIAVPEDTYEEPYATGVIFGGRRGMTPDHKTSVSAVALLVERDNELVLFVYHNVYAAIPLRPDLLRFPNIRHYTVDLQTDNSFSEWREIK